jgi:probable phosphoglycerate mutase
LKPITEEQKWPNLLMIVRHGESERNVAKELAKSTDAHGRYGSGLRDVDTPLTVKGRQQAKETGLYLAGRHQFDAVFASPYKRTRETSEAILSAYEPKPNLILEERIREIEFGILDGLTANAIREKYPDEFERKQREQKYWYRPLGGESRPDVALRVHSFLGTLTRDYRGKNVLVVCHSVVVLIFRRLLERWGEEEYMKVDRENDVLNCSLTIYEFDPVTGKLVLRRYNELPTFSAAF